MTASKHPPAKKRRASAPFAYVAASPHIVWAIMFIVAPLLFVLYYAFTDSTGAFTWNNILALGDHTETFTLSFSMSVIATVPISVAVTAELTAKIKVFFKAANVSALRNSSSYQYSEKPVKTPVLLVLLKENSIRTRMGTYKTVSTKAM